MIRLIPVLGLVAFLAFAGLTAATYDDGFDPVPGGTCALDPNGGCGG